MNNKAKPFFATTRASAAGLSSTVLLLCASLPSAQAAEDPAVAALTQPSSSMDVGIGNVSEDSYKFGEYNGLEEKGGFVLGSLDLNGGGSYDSSSARRWRLRADNVGLKTSEADFSFRDQGRFSFNLGLGGLRHNISDSYSTPFVGAGSNSLALPSTWLKPVVPQLNNNVNFRSLLPETGMGNVINSTGVLVGPTPAQQATLDAIVGADAGAFNRFNLHTQRRHGELGFTANLRPDVLLTGSVRRETRNGYKPIGAVSSAVQENGSILPEHIDTTTDQFNLGIEYTNKRGFLKAGFYGSVFDNDVHSISWQDPANPARTASLSSAPSNRFHQVNLSSGYSFTRSTRLVADFSYGDARQNASLLADASLPLGLPRDTANAAVVTRQANIRLTSRFSGNLSGFARYRYDARDNRTPVDTFVFYDVNLAPGATASAFNAALGLAPGTLASNVNIYSNRPQNRRQDQYTLGGDYTYGRQKLSADLDWQKVARYCLSTWINCADAPESRERALHLQWQGQLSDAIDARLGYARSERRVDYNSNAWLALVPMANVTPGAPIVGASTSVYGYLTQNGLTGFGPLAGYPTTPLTGDAAIFSPNNNIVPQSLYGSRDNVSEIPGMRRFNLADRDRDRLRSSLGWQAGERLSLQAGFEYDRDEYAHSMYGLQQSSNWSASLEGAYVLNDRMSASAFYTREDMHTRAAGDSFGSNSNTAFVGRAGNTLVDGSCYQTVQTRNNNAKLDPCLIWSARTHDTADTFGVSFTRRGLWAHRLDLNADLVYSDARTDIAVRGASYANNPYALAGAPVLAADVPATLLIPAADLPSVVTRTLELRLAGNIALNKSSDLRLVYLYERSRVRDFAYEGLQFGTGTNYLPTLEQAPDYSVNVIAAHYRYRF